MSKYECEIKVAHDCYIGEHNHNRDCETYDHYADYFTSGWTSLSPAEITKRMDDELANIHNSSVVEYSSNEKYPFSSSIEEHSQQIDLSGGQDNEDGDNLDDELLSLAKMKFINYTDIEDITSGNLNPLQLLMKDGTTEHENNVMSQAIFEDKKRRFSRVWDIVTKRCSDAQKQVVDLAIGEVIDNGYINQENIAAKLHVTRQAVGQTLKRVQNHLPEPMRDYLKAIKNEKTTTEKLLSSNWKATSDWNKQKQKANEKLQQKALKNLYYHQGL